MTYSEKETYYEILKLKKNCSQQEIKQAFIELSKKHHPDKSTDCDGGLFIRVNEAYSVLGKPAARHQYDQFLATAMSSDSRVYYQYYENVYSTRNVKWHSKPAPQPYYGVAGVKKKSNSVIVMLCCVFGLIGAGLQFYLIRKSSTFSRDRINDDSARNYILLEFARNQAKVNGIDVQLNKLLDDSLRGPSLEQASEEYKRRSKNIQSNKE